MTAAAISLALAKFVAWEAAMFSASLAIARWFGGTEESRMACRPLTGMKNRRDRAEPTQPQLQTPTPNSRSSSERPVEMWLAVLAIDITLESSLAALFSFAGWNSPLAYWLVAAACLAGSAACLVASARSWVASARSWVASAQSWRSSVPESPDMRHTAVAAALLVPLIFLSFKPVEEIDSINYLHYLIEWMANRATPYTFATNYVAFWELSFLPTWMVTGVDLFFPLLALKAVVLLALALWLAGTGLGLEGNLLLWAVFASLTMRHYWYEYSGVPTLKNDALHGAGFVLLALVVLRAARGVSASSDIALLAVGTAFVSVKYTGIFMAVIAAALAIWLARPAIRSLLLAAVFFLLTSGHYYLHNFARYGSPFYPFQINLAFLHLPGTADLSNTSILYSLHDPRLWRALFLPEGGVSPAGLLFPATLAGVLIAAAWRCLRATYTWVRARKHLRALDWTAALLLCGWLLYFRSVFSASGYAGDLSFIRNNLNSIRYVDGVLALSEIFLVAVLARFTPLVWTLIVVNMASRMAALCARIPTAVFPPVLVCAITLAMLGLLLFVRRRPWLAALVVLLVASPVLVERNRLLWTTYWNDLKPSLDQFRGNGLNMLALEDGGYFAGHVVAAGVPLHMSVRALLPEDLEALPTGARPRYLALMVTSGSPAAADWRSRYGQRLTEWGYAIRNEGKYGALLERK